MAVLIVPKDYNTLQAAIDAAKPGDKIEIEPNTTLAENITIEDKDNISISAIGKSVTLDGSTKDGIGILLKSNNVSIRGLLIECYDQGVFIIGNENRIINVTTKNMTRSGISIRGYRNMIRNCICNGKSNACIDIQGSYNVGIDIEGSYNEIIANRVDYNNIGIAASAGKVIGNIFYKNIFYKNTEFGAIISSTRADKNVFIENTISNSIYGIVCNFGRVAIISNYINNCDNTAVVYKNNNGLILENVLTNNNTGMSLDTSKSAIAANTVQTGEITGIYAIGNENIIARNVVTFYDNTGLLVNGCKNTLGSNNLEQNGVNQIVAGDFNITNGECRYNGILEDSDNGVLNKNIGYLVFLEIFEKSNDAYVKCIRCRNIN